MAEEQNQRRLEEMAADCGDVTAGELERMQRWDDLLILDLSMRSPLEGPDRLAAAAEAERKLWSMVDLAWNEDFFGDNDALKMLLWDAGERALNMRIRLQDEVEALGEER